MNDTLKKAGETGRNIAFWVSMSWIFLGLVAFSLDAVGILDFSTTIPLIMLEGFFVFTVTIKLIKRFFDENIECIFK